MTFLKNYMPEWRQQIKQHKYNERTRRWEYRPLKDDEMAVVYATINDVLVAPIWQGQGIGSSIIRKLVQLCEHHDIRSIHLFADKDASRFYQHLGFAARPTGSPGMVYEKI